MRLIRIDNDGEKKLPLLIIERLSVHLHSVVLYYILIFNLLFFYSVSINNINSNRFSLTLTSVCRPSWIGRPTIFKISPY